MHMARKNVPDWWVVAAALHRRVNRGDLIEWLSEWSGEPYKVCLRAAERAAQRHHIDWGVSINTAWATESGAKLVLCRTDLAYEEAERRSCAEEHADAERLTALW